MSFILRLLLSVAAVWATVRLGELIKVGLGWKGLSAALFFVIALAVVNAIIRPIVKLIALPLNCLTFGLFAFVINALLFWGTAAVTGWIRVDGFLAALFGSVVYGILSGIISGLVKRRSES